MDDGVFSFGTFLNADRFIDFPRLAWIEMVNRITENSQGLDYYRDLFRGHSRDFEAWSGSGIVDPARFRMADFHDSITS